MPLPGKRLLSGPASAVELHSSPRRSNSRATAGRSPLLIQISVGCVSARIFPSQGVWDPWWGKSRRS